MCITNTPTATLPWGKQNILPLDATLPLQCCTRQLSWGRSCCPRRAWTLGTSSCCQERGNQQQNHPKANTPNHSKANTPRSSAGCNDHVGVDAILDLSNTDLSHVMDNIFQLLAYLQITRDVPTSTPNLTLSNPGWNTVYVNY